MDNFWDSLLTKLSNLRTWIATLLQGHDDAHEFQPLLLEIEDSPLSPLGRFTFWIVILILVCLLCWMFWGKVDVVVSVRGKVVPDGEIKVVQAYTPGVIRAIHVKECDYVSKDALLMEIDSSSAQADLSAYTNALNVINLDLIRLDALLNNKPFHPGSQFPPDQVMIELEMYRSAYSNQEEKTGSKRAEIARDEAQIKGLQGADSITQRLLNAALEKQNRLDKVLDIIPKSDYEKAQSDVLVYRSNMSDNLSRVMEIRQHQNQMTQELNSIRQTFREGVLQEYSLKQAKKSELEAQIAEKQFNLNRATIVAPVAGYVQKLMVNTVGGVLTAAQPVLTLVPANVPLIVKATLQPSDVGFVKKDMPVALKLDAYSFQKYGVMNAGVLSLSKDTTEHDNSGPLYDLYVMPYDKYIQVDGKREFLATGMTLTAEIKTGKRRIIEFFVYPLIKYLDEGISVQ